MSFPPCTDVTKSPAAQKKCVHLCRFVPVVLVVPFCPVSMAATTQGCMNHDSPLLAKLINAMVDTVGEGVAEGVVGGLGLDTNGEELKEIVRTLFAIFYVDDAYLVTWFHPVWDSLLQFVLVLMQNLQTIIGLKSSTVESIQF